MGVHVMNSRVFRIGALCTALLAVGLTSAARAETKSRTVSIDLADVPFGRVIQLLASSANVEIVMSDPEGKLADKHLALVTLKDRPIEEAFKYVCAQANAYFERDKQGVFFTPAQPLKSQEPAPRPAGDIPPVDLREDVRPVPSEVTIQKINLQYMDPNECIRFLMTSSTKR